MFSTAGLTQASLSSAIYITELLHSSFCLNDLLIFLVGLVRGIRTHNNYVLSVAREHPKHRLCFTVVAIDIDYCFNIQYRMGIGVKQ